MMIFEHRQLVPPVFKAYPGQIKRFQTIWNLMQNFIPF